MKNSILQSKNLGYDLSMQINIIPLLISFLLSSSVYAEQHIKCLGRAEANIHRLKIGGAYTTINQLMIGELIQMNNTIKLRKTVLNEVCSSKTPFPSLVLLECLLVNKEKCFLQKISANDTLQKAINDESIKEIVNNAPMLFIRFINSIQAQLNEANCLTKKIPELEKFYYKTRYTLEDTSYEKLISEIKNLPDVFVKLQSPKIFNACKKPAQL